MGKKDDDYPDVYRGKVFQYHNHEILGCDFNSGE